MASLYIRAEEFNSSHGFFIDLPEGFALTGSDGTTEFMFTGPDGKTFVDIRVYDASRYASVAAMIDSMKKNQGAVMAPKPFSYAGKNCAFGDFTAGTGAQAMRGSVFILDDAVQGADKKNGFDLILLSYTTAANFAGSKDFIASAIDGFSINDTFRGRSGPLTAAIRSGVPQTDDSVAEITFGKAVISMPWNKRNAAVAQELVEREYRVLAPYGNVPELIEGAVRRFYRMIYRDGAHNLDRLSLALSQAWETGAYAGISTGTAGMALRFPAEGQSSKTPSASQAASPVAPPAAARYGVPTDPRGYAQAILSWVQGFKYERDTKGSDVVNSISTAMEARGDCDSRAVLMAILLKAESIDAAMMVSLVHSHALAAVNAPGLGARFPYLETKWLVAETTATVDIGRIDQKQSNIEDWIGIDFPY